MHTLALLVLLLSEHDSAHWELSCDDWNQARIEVLSDENLNSDAHEYLIDYFRTKVSDASKPTRNGFVHLLRETQKPTEGTDLKSPTTLGETKWQRLLTEEFSTILKLVKRKLSSLRNNLFTEALLYKELSKMIVVTEILLASVVFLAIIYAEAQLLYNYK